MEEGTQSVAAAATTKDMEGKTVLITGGNTGIGYCTAHALLQRGARVVLGCRSEERASQAVARLKDAVPEASVDFELVDLCSLRSVQDFAEEILRLEARLDVLILNAGGLGPDSRQTTREGLEYAFASNYLGHFHLANLLLPLLERSAPSRIIMVTSNVHKMGAAVVEDLQAEKNYGKIRAYCQSKMCQVLHCVELARRLRGKNITVNCLHPGVVATEFLRGRWYASLIRWASRTPEKGAETSIYLATSPDVRETTGQYFVDCRVTTPHRLSTDDDARAKLWTASEELVKGTLKN
ncbi:retinol dehydrogenase 14-like [Tropilaelaps mercedesae]|uniref:Retinol dehydrogenase 14-like n=1 Tax=Tropilaelaps mercedesae TaxID=418985 RepID=A0A1V9WYU5_9ACAR|nr:retinol dehydrogenase 14-like [Tropilaelaps mercedesae]